MRKAHYFVELDRPEAKLRVAQWDEADLRACMKEKGVSQPLALHDYDRPVFDSERKALRFFAKYLMILKRLTNRRLCTSRELPAILYKRRYMVLTLMGLKNQTYRGYRKEWTPGQLFNLHDQVFFLTVRLTSLTYDKREGLYCYKFKVVGKP